MMSPSLGVLNPLTLTSVVCVILGDSAVIHGFHQAF